MLWVLSSLLASPATKFEVRHAGRAAAALRSIQESPLRDEFGSQSPAFSEPLSSPASPTQQNKPFLLNAKEYVIQFYGVVKNDQYLNPLGATCNPSQCPD